MNENVIRFIIFSTFQRTFPLVAEQTFRKTVNIRILISGRQHFQLKTVLEEKQINVTVLRTKQLEGGSSLARTYACK